jgi:hypothetical protein
MGSPPAPPSLLPPRLLPPLLLSATSESLKEASPGAAGAVLAAAGCGSEESRTAAGATGFAVGSATALLLSPPLLPAVALLLFLRRNTSKKLWRSFEGAGAAAPDGADTALLTGDAAPAAAAAAA